VRWHPRSILPAWHARVSNSSSSGGPRPSDGRIRSSGRERGGLAEAGMEVGYLHACRGQKFYLSFSFDLFHFLSLSSSPLLLSTNTTSPMPRRAWVKLTFRGSDSVCAKPETLSLIICVCVCAYVLWLVEYV
jgi:hypothetical protein